MRPFAVAKFFSLLPVGLLAAAEMLAFKLTDAVVLGHVIGEDALAGFCLLLPLQVFVSFTATSIAAGMATSYSISLGRLDRLRASRFFVLAIVLSLALGGALAALCRYGAPAYLAALDGSEYVTMYAEQYLQGFWPRAPLEGVFLSLLLLAVVDADRLVVTVASALTLAVKVAFSYVSVDRFGAGAAGCAYGTLAAYGAGALVLLLHFARASSTFRPVLPTSLRDAWTILRASVSDTSAVLAMAALFFLINAFLIRFYGSDLLPAACPVMMLLIVEDAFGGVALAARPLVSVYYGERNARGVARLLRASLATAVALGLAAVAAFAVFPDAVVWLAGIEEPDLLAPARQGARIFAAALGAFAPANLFRSYCLFVERPRVSLFVSVACCLLGPAAGLLALGPQSLTGVWTGLAVGPYLGLACLLAILRLRYGRVNLLLMPRRGEDRLRMIDLPLEPDAIVAASKRVGGLVPPAVSLRAALLVEEVFMAVRDRNAGRSLRGEVTLDRTAGGVTLTLRDDGEIFDITDADQRISSLRTYLVASVMERQVNRLSLAAVGFNRNVFRL